jgi:hypothetical protein
MRYRRSEIGVTGPERFYAWRPFKPALELWLFISRCPHLWPWVKSKLNGTSAFNRKNNGVP